MHLSRRLFKTSQFFFRDRLSGSVRTQQLEKEMMEKERKIKAIELLDKVKLDMKELKLDHNYWDQLRKNTALIKLRFTSINFENRFLDLIYDYKLYNVELLNSLKDYFIYRKIDQNPILKSAYGQLLLMLNDSKYDDEIEQIYKSLEENKILNEQLCTNFLIAYSRSSIDRFRRCFDYLNKANFKNIQLEKRIEFMNIAQDYYDLDRLFSLFRLFFLSDRLLMSKFRELSLSLRDEDNFLKLLKATSEMNCALEIDDFPTISRRLEQFNYKATKIKPNDLKCPNCGERMSTLEPEENEKLKKHFLKKFLDQIKNLADPRKHTAIHSFVNFITDPSNKFDLIIDGSNLSFQGTVTFRMQTIKNGGIDLKPNYDFLETNLISSLDCLVKSGKYKNILYVSNYSQSNYQRLMKFTYDHKIKIRFFTSDIDDDLSIILASLYNFNSRIATNDYFLNHLQLINNDELKKYFHKFLGTRLVSLVRGNQMINYYNEGWHKVVQINEQNKTIHIPFDTQDRVYK